MESDKLMTLFQYTTTTAFIIIVIVMVSIMTVILILYFIGKIGENLMDTRSGQIFLGALILCFIFFLSWGKWIPLWVTFFFIFVGLVLIYVGFKGKREMNQDNAIPTTISPSNQKRFCGSCGVTLSDEDSQFCSHCGKKIE